MTAPIDDEALRQLAMYNCYGFDLADSGELRRCCIAAPNLWAALKDNILPPVEMLMVSVTPSSAHELTTIDPSKLKDVKIFALSGTATDDVESRMGLSDDVIDWLGKLPKQTVVAVNNSGFSPMTLTKLRQHPEVKDRFHLADPEGRLTKPPKGRTRPEPSDN